MIPVFSQKSYHWYYLHKPCSNVNIRILWFSKKNVDVRWRKIVYNHLPLTSINMYKRFILKKLKVVLINIRLKTTATAAHGRPINDTTSTTEPHQCHRSSEEENLPIPTFFVFWISWASRGVVWHRLRHDRSVLGFGCGAGR